MHSEDPSRQPGQDGRPVIEQEIDFSEKKDHLLSCPRCKHFISGHDIQIEQTIAKCSNCQHVFGFEHDHETKRLRPAHLIPEGIEALKLRSELDIRLKWIDTTSKSGRWFFTLFAGMWNLILMPFVIMVIVSGAWGLLLFLSAHLMVGLGLMWHLATIYMNRTSISVTNNRVKISTFPIRPFLWRNKELPVDEIKQLYVSRYVQSTTNGNPNYAFALYAIMRDGKKISLLRGMNRETQLYLEKEIEDYLGIKDRKVPDEEPDTVQFRA